MKTTKTTKATRATRLLLALLVLLFAVPALAAPGLALAPGDTAPELRGKTTKGDRAILDYGAAEFTLVNFWATWCRPCTKEMPTLQGLYEKVGGDKFQLWGVTNEAIELEAVRDFVDTMKITYPCVLPQERYLAKWGGITSMPTSFLVNREGRILRRYVGATDEQIGGMVYDIEAVLDGRPMGPFIFDEGGSVSDKDRRELKRKQEGK